MPLSVFENQALCLCWILEFQMEIQEWEAFPLLSVLIDFCKWSNQFSISESEN